MREFIDEHHSMSKKYYEIMDSYTGKNVNTVISKLKKLIQKDPNYFEAYNSLQDLLSKIGKKEEANIIIKQASERALKRIADRLGNWPDRLEWMYLENRHVIRALFNQALLFWKEDTIDSALNLFRKLLHSNPNDNLGVRYFILAIRKNIKFSEFDEWFNKKGFYTNEIDHWFYNNYLLFPEEFEWWEKELENEDDLDEEFDVDEFLGDSGIRFI